MRSKVKTICPALAVQSFKILTKFCEEQICSLQIRSGNTVLINDADALDKFAEVLIEGEWKDVMKQCWTVTIDPGDKLPSFIATTDFLCRIWWWAVKRAWKIREGSSNCCTMLLPNITN